MIHDTPMAQRMNPSFVQGKSPAFFDKKLPTIHNAPEPSCIRQSQLDGCVHTEYNKLMSLSNFLR